MKNTSKKNIISFIYKGGRKKRLIDKNIEFPSEFFYGYIELMEKGYNVKIIEENDLGFRLRNKYLDSGLIFLSKMFFNIPLNMFLGFILVVDIKNLRDLKLLLRQPMLLNMFAQKSGFLKNKVLYK